MDARPNRVIGAHVNNLLTFPSGDPADMAVLTPEEQKRLGRFRQFQDDMMGYMHIQGTRPLTLSYALIDSPAGQLAWIVEKFKEWTNPAVDLPGDAVDRDRMLANVSIYRFTETARSSPSGPTRSCTGRSSAAAATSRQSDHSSPCRGKFPTLLTSVSGVASAISSATI